MPRERLGGVIDGGSESARHRDVLQSGGFRQTLRGAAAVPFYGRQPRADTVSPIKAPLLIHYAELDTRLNAGWPVYEEALKANGKTYVMHMYAGASHGFHNDTTPRFDEDAASLAWQRTLDFFAEHLH